jgi:prevent-host-death family protein
LLLERAQIDLSAHKQTIGHFPFGSIHGYNSHEEGANQMRSVNVAELKNRLSKYLTFAKAGEEVVIRDRNLPVAKLVPFSAEGADDQELVLVAAGKLRLPKVRLDVKELLKIPTGSVRGNKAIQAVLADREEER